jgi:phosphonopyruvate decarboxylase
MLKPQDFYNLLKENNFTFFTGVPDSTLKDLCSYITDNTVPERNIITPNEGNAIALASGHYFASKNPGVVYMQNSGQGNAINPLASLADPLAYSVPMLLIIGWRGEPGKKDEPQHKRQGIVTTGLLNVLGINYQILPDDIELAKKSIENAKEDIEKNKVPHAIIIRKGIFEKYSLQNVKNTNYGVTREDAIKTIVPLISDSAAIISTTGKTSRELFELRARDNSGHHRDFLTIGSMGHASTIALGVALEKPNKEVYCFDGDGAFIMHMGTLTSIGQQQPKNLRHIIFNNFAHDSVGGQPTASDVIDIPKIALACGYKAAFRAQNSEEIVLKLNEMKLIQGPTLLEVCVDKGARKDLGRPTKTPLENKGAFMDFLQG